MSHIVNYAGSTEVYAQRRNEYKVYGAVFAISVIGIILGAVFSLKLLLIFACIFAGPAVFVGLLRRYNSPGTTHEEEPGRTCYYQPLYLTVGDGKVTHTVIMQEKSGFPFNGMTLRMQGSNHEPTVCKDDVFNHGGCVNFVRVSLVARSHLFPHKKNLVRVQFERFPDPQTNTNYYFRTDDAQKGFLKYENLTLDEQKALDPMKMSLVKQVQENTDLPKELIGIVMQYS